MQESFRQLKPEKQQKIIHAAMKVFAQSPYSKASTDDIASLAGISKGLLFYHFKNKKELYCFLYEYSCGKILEGIEQSGALAETDFFDRNIKITQSRVRTLAAYPDIFEFALRAYYETEPLVAAEIKTINQQVLNSNYRVMYENIDTSRFRCDEDIGKAIRMIVWIGDGFIKERRTEGKLDLQALEAEACTYIEVLRQGFYRSNKE
ncbi:TetR/AcrR family transcriptional regulator [Acetanaerobacterium elongatum]|uniref:Transcriptional regulator, TetR family n=1 Tax=Acetanaerobacterium elongatum TaxID=258515 RepID=A0A1G9W7Z4_9FIRM|nr:TetR/AcrR family transcriptional regulator [Acetanaerobacterium elongatum]SDM80361.1 transcriptional regulator, TetR family [Acetanaerobacterium elongatum]